MEVELSSNELKIRFDPKDNNEKNYIHKIVDRIEFTYKPDYVYFVAGNRVVGRTKDK